MPAQRCVTRFMTTTNMFDQANCGMFDLMEWLTYLFLALNCPVRWVESELFLVLRKICGMLCADFSDFFLSLLIVKFFWCKIFISFRLLNHFLLGVCANRSKTANATLPIYSWDARTFYQRYAKSSVHYEPNGSWKRSRRARKFTQQSETISIERCQ